MGNEFLAQLLQNVPALISKFSGSGSAPYLKQQKATAAQQANISDAMTNTNNPLYQQLYGQYQQQNKNNLAQVIAEAQGQNRMATNMGRTPLFDPARGGETMFRSLMSGYQGLGTQSDTQTRQALGQAAQGNIGALNAYNNVSQYGGAADASKLSGFDTLANLLKTKSQPSQMSQPFTGGYPNMNNPSTQGINWNQPQYQGYQGY